MPQNIYRVPTATARTEVGVARSRFIATAAFAPTPDASRQFIAQIRREMADANHHVYAFRAGYAPSVIEGMSDDGEPSGTAGPPILAVLRGQPIGDVVVVVTRYFGGTLLGTGGLVRVYTEAAQSVIAILPTALNIPRTLFGVALPYPIFEQVRRMIHAHEGEIEDETFEGEITLIVRMPTSQYDPFCNALTELSAGRLAPVVLD